MSLLRLGPAAEYVGVHPVTLRRWADEGRVAVRWVGRERRFDAAVLDALIGQADEERPRREALYVRVSGTTGQGSSRAAFGNFARDHPPTDSRESLTIKQNNFG